MRAGVIVAVAALLLATAFLLLRGSREPDSTASLQQQPRSRDRQGAVGAPGAGPDGAAARARDPLAPGAAAGRGAGTASGPLRAGGETRNGRAAGDVVAGAAGGSAAPGGGSAAFGSAERGAADVGAADQGDPLAAGDHGADAAADDGTAPNPGGERETADAAFPGVVFASEAEQEYVTTEPTDIPDMDDFSRDAGAVSFWLEPGWEGGDQNDADFIDLGDGGLRVVKNVNYLRFEYTDANGNPGGVGIEITGWEIGKARQVTASWDGATISLFVDGQLVSQRNHGGLVRNEERGPVVVGSVYPPDRPIAPGVLSGVTLFNRPLDPGEVTSIYQAGNRKK